MGYFYVVLVDDGVVECGVDFGVAEDFLDLFDWHAPLDGHGGHGTAEFMWVDMGYAGFLTEFAQHAFNTGNGQAVPWGLQADEEGWVGVCPVFQVFLQVDFGFGVEIDRSFFVTFSEDDTFAFCKINVRPVEIDQFTDTDAGGNEKIDDGSITGVAAFISEFFEIFIGQGFFDDLGGFYFMNTADRAFKDIIFIFQPGKERRHNAADIVDGDFAGVAGVLVIGQVEAKVVGCNVSDSFSDCIKNGFECISVISKGVF